MAEERRYSLRKRKAPSPSADDQALDKLLEVASTCSNIVLFTGSGLSASSGMSTFSTPGGLYERAQKKFGLQDGKKLFCYSFFDRQRIDVQPFFADIYDEALGARAAPGHRAIAAIHRAGKLLRHYTLNIDGLAAGVGMDTWHPDNNPEGITVEMHGSIRQLVCPACDVVCDVTEEHLMQLRAKQALPCHACGEGVLRWRVMMYDDAESESITPEGVMDVLDTDMETADCVLWIGLSFEQSATTSYFRRVRSALASAGRFSQVPQFLINPSDEALWNLLSSCSNQGEVEVHAITASSDKILPKVAKIIKASASAGYKNNQENNTTSPPTKHGQPTIKHEQPASIPPPPLAASAAPDNGPPLSKQAPARGPQEKENNTQQQQPQAATKPSISQQPAAPTSMLSIPQPPPPALFPMPSPPPPPPAAAAFPFPLPAVAPFPLTVEGLHQLLGPLAAAAAATGGPAPLMHPLPLPLPHAPLPPMAGLLQQPPVPPAAALALWQQVAAAQQVLAAAAAAVGGQGSGVVEGQGGGAGEGGVHSDVPEGGEQCE